MCSCCIETYCYAGYPISYSHDLSPELPQPHEPPVPPQPSAPQQPAVECTEIESSLDLENVLDQVDTPYERMCSHLSISSATCIQLKNSGRLSVFAIAQAYIDQHPRACWEDILRCLCKNFRKNKLSSDIAKQHSIHWSHSKYCS